MAISLLLLTAACAQMPGVSRSAGLNPVRKAEAVRDAKELRARGGRVWCVPFARTASGIDIHGNARTWWQQAEDRFDRGHKPEVGAVMAFRATRRIPLGHVAVVSKVVSPRLILVDQANWHRNRVSLNMAVMDVSRDNDWSSVRVESFPDRFGAVYPVTGFISSPDSPAPITPAPIMAMARTPAKAIPEKAEAAKPVVVAELTRKPAAEQGPRPELRPRGWSEIARTETGVTRAHPELVVASIRPHLRPRHWMEVASAD